MILKWGISQRKNTESLRTNSRKELDALVELDRKTLTAESIEDEIEEGNP